MVPDLSRLANRCDASASSALFLRASMQPYGAGHMPADHPVFSSVSSSHCAQPLCLNTALTADNLTFRTSPGLWQQHISRFSQTSHRAPNRSLKAITTWERTGDRRSGKKEMYMPPGRVSCSPLSDKRGIWATVILHEERLSVFPQRGKCWAKRKDER